MAYRTYPLRELARGSISNTTSQLVQTKRVEEGWTWVVTSYSAEDEDNAPTAFKFVIVSGSETYDVAEHRSNTAGQKVDGEKTLILTGGESLGVVVEGGTSADNIELVALGFMLPPDVPFIP